MIGYALGALTGLGWLASVLAPGFAAVAVLVSFWESDRVVLTVTGARPADPVEHRRYHNLVEGLCIAANLPKPRLYVVASPALNAYATGRDPEHAAVAVTTGLLDALNRVELEGVLAHELAHVRNLDVRLMMVVTVVVGALVLLADWTRRALWYGGLHRDHRRTDQAIPVLVVVGVLAAILAPVAARLLRFAVSRQREYLADMTGVLLTRYPPGLTGALRKIAGDSQPLRQASAATAHLWISDPYKGRAWARRRDGGGASKWLQTHPPIEDRIARLERL